MKDTKDIIVIEEAFTNEQRAIACSEVESIRSLGAFITDITLYDGTVITAQMSLVEMLDLINDSDFPIFSPGTKISRKLTVIDHLDFWRNLTVKSEPK